MLIASEDEPESLPSTNNPIPNKISRSSHVHSTIAGNFSPPPPVSLRPAAAQRQHRMLPVLFQEDYEENNAPTRKPCSRSPFTSAHTRPRTSYISQSSTNRRLDRKGMTILPASWGSAQRDYSMTKGSQRYRATLGAPSSHSCRSSDAAMSSIFWLKTLLIPRQRLAAMLLNFSLQFRMYSVSSAFRLDLITCITFGRQAPFHSGYGRRLFSTLSLGLC